MRSPTSHGLWLLLLLAGPTSQAWAGAKEQYELKCLYCHSNTVIERLKLTPPQWRKMVERMRDSAPLLISRSDVGALTRYIVEELKLVPKETVARRVKRPPPKVLPTGTGTDTGTGTGTGTGTVVASGTVGAEEVVNPPTVTGSASWLSTIPEYLVFARVTQPVGTSASLSTGQGGGLTGLGEQEVTEEPEDEEAKAEAARIESAGTALLGEKCSRCHTLYRVYTKIDSLETGMSIVQRMRKKTGSGISPEDADVLERFIRLRTMP
ncbi:MAG: hypothetical protein ACOZIN_05710 [Myxococcota bacterium]